MVGFFTVSMVVRPSSGAGNAETGKTANTAQNDSELLLDDPVKYVQDYTKKKIRNLEKRKSKLDGYKAKMNKGETLSKDQQEAGELLLIKSNMNFQPFQTFKMNFK